MPDIDTVRSWEARTCAFRSQFGQAMATLMAQDPDPYVFVSSIPNLYQLWQVLHTSSLGPLGLVDGQDLPVHAGRHQHRHPTPAGQGP